MPAPFRWRVAQLVVEPSEALLQAIVCVEINVARDAVGVVPGGQEVLGQGREGCAQTALEVPEARGRGKLRGEERPHRRQGPRGGGVSALEDLALGRELIEGRSARRRSPVGAELVGPQRVDAHDQQIPRRCGRGAAAGREQHRQRQESCAHALLPYQARPPRPAATLWRPPRRGRKVRARLA